MAATEHFKTAASALANARQEKKREIDDLRKYIERKEVDYKHHEQDVNSKVRQMEHSIDQASKAVNTPGQDPAREKAQIIQSMAALKRSLSDNSSNFTNEKRQVLAQIKQLEREVISLDQQIREFESRR